MITVNNAVKLIELNGDKQDLTQEYMYIDGAPESGVVKIMVGGVQFTAEAKDIIAACQNCINRNFDHAENLQKEIERGNFED